MDRKTRNRNPQQNQNNQPKTNLVNKILKQPNNLNHNQTITKAIQINLHGSRVATSAAIGYIESNGIQLALLQDFHQNKKTSKITGVNYNNWAVTKTKDNRSAILTYTGTNPIMLKELTYTTAILLENNKEKITVINSYAPPQAEFNDILDEIEEVINITKGEILLTGDFNAHSQQWGYADIDQRGNSMTDFMLQHSLFLVNPPGAPPSFHTVRGTKELKGWPDLTMSTIKLKDSITNWEISDDESLSDHRYIKFQIDYNNEDYHRHRLETKHGKHAKFESKVRKIRNCLI